MKLLIEKNAFQWFASLFQNAKVEKNEEAIVSDSNGNFFSKLGQWFPELERNQMWHTITSSFLWIIFFGFLLLFSIFIPFIVEKDKVATILGIIFIFGILAFLIWITQWLFGLIPVILNRAYINYTIQLGLNLIPIMSLTIGIVKEVKKTKVS